ncbi:MAG: IclR family transcriptional regulator [Alphaproteobacteria bacterium]
MPKATTTEPTPDQEKGLHQNIARATAVLSALADAADQGLRAADVARVAGFGKATTHRLLAGLAAHGLIEQDEATGRFFIGLRILSWAAAAGSRFGLAQIAAAGLRRLTDLSRDTVYLHLRSGDEAVCLERLEGSFPIKTLTLDVGDRRPLGIGTGSLAILAALSDQEAERILVEREGDRAPFPFPTPRLREMIAVTRRSGFAFNDVHVIEGDQVIHDMAAVALPIHEPGGGAVAAISIAAITSRLPHARQQTLLTAMRREVQDIERQLARAAAGPADASQRVRGSR